MKNNKKKKTDAKVKLVIDLKHNWQSSDWDQLLDRMILTRTKLILVMETENETVYFCRMRTPSKEVVNHLREYLHFDKETEFPGSRFGIEDV